MTDPTAAFQKIKALLSPAVVTEIEQRLKRFQARHVEQHRAATKRAPLVTTPWVMRPQAPPRPHNRSYFTL